MKRAPFFETTAWWFHDVLVHPFTGNILLAAKLLPSPRLAALAHHVHNASSPVNDSMADYAEAATRAGCNESLRTPGEESNCWACGDPGWRGRMITHRNYAPDTFPKHKTKGGLICPMSGLDDRDSYKKAKEFRPLIQAADLVLGAVQDYLLSDDFLVKLAEKLAERKP